MSISISQEAALLVPGHREVAKRIGTLDRATLAWLIVASIIPFAVVVFWPSAYALYFGGLSVIAIPYLSVGKLPYIKSFPALFSKWALSLLLIVYYTFHSIPSVINLTAILVAELFIYLSIFSIKWTTTAIILFAQSCLAVSIFVIVAGFIFSIIGAPLGITNSPITAFVVSHRLLILTPKLAGGGTYGHSILIYVGFLSLLVGASNIGALKWWKNLLACALGITALVTSGTVVGVLAAASVVGVMAIEQFRATRWVSNLAHLTLIVLAVTTALYPDLLSEILEFVRLTLLGKVSSQYGHDLTAGRTLLNNLMIGGISRSPMVGLGHDDPLLQFGSALENGRSVNQYQAYCESSLRTAAAYGLPFFILLLGLVVSPLRNLSMYSKSIRIFSVGIVLGTVIFMSANDVLEVPHSAEFYFLVSLLFFATSIGRSNVARS